MTQAMIFISYSNEDEGAAGALRDRLVSNQYPCFLAHDDIEATSDWHEEIWKCLHSSHAFVGLVTDDFNGSAFCQQEIGAALALGLPSLLVFAGSRKLAGFAARFQAVKPTKLIVTLNTLPKFRRLRAEAWIHGTKHANTYAEANATYSHFYDEWKSMNEDEHLRWILAGAGNNQVYDEGYHVGPFYKKMRKALEPHLTDQWLYENDKESVLHVFDLNPIGFKK